MTTPNRFLPRFSHLRFLVAAAILTCATWLLFSSSSSSPSPSQLRLGQSGDGGAGQGKAGSVDASAPHPIEALIGSAQKEWRRLLDHETRDVGAAAAAYRARRGRHPPPGFEAWFAFARNRSAVVVEQFWDRVYDDLGPFWGVDPTAMRALMKGLDHVVSVRNGELRVKTDKGRSWMTLWANLTAELAGALPDLDFGVNMLDESRVVVPWETVDKYMEKERQTRRLVNVSEVVSEYEVLPVLDQYALKPLSADFKAGQPYWDFVRQGCSPASPGRQAESVTDFSGPPPLSKDAPPYSYMGYVSNWTTAKDPCLQPELRELHGTFVEPVSMSTSTKLLPLFGGSKLPMNNEILLPPAMYWSDDPFYSGGEDHGPPWDQKTDSLIWRGDASGGRNREKTWHRFQRHRFLSMMNGTAVSHAESQQAHLHPNFALPSPSAYPHASRLGARTLGAWLSSFADARFINLICFPTRPKDDPHCDYTDPFYSLSDPLPMAHQYRAKFLPDVDGNSFSGRYRGFLRSTSMPLKATIYAEWHDSRLVPWAHFVPLHNTFVDVYGVLEFFVGAQVGRGRDEEARRIAEDGRDWAEKVLRREDMLIYVYRLLLEWARVMDERREYLGWVGDLVD